MNTHKEYPATHSMETAWFDADADGYKAIMQCGLYGPAPTDDDVKEYYNSSFAS